MSTPGQPTDITLAMITGHMTAAETALVDVDPDNAVAACEAALAELRLANSIHDQYVRGISHDLRNTLTSISGEAQLLQRYLTNGTITPDRIVKALGRIDRSVTAANAIIRRLTGS